MTAQCFDCPRRCGALRDEDTSRGFCGCGFMPRVVKAMLHTWEEPCISGTGGAGAIFFSGCSLRCVFCQNNDISCRQTGHPADMQFLRDMMLDLVRQGAETIDLVNPTHLTRRLGEVLEGFDPGVPIVYNTGGYDSLEGLERMNGKISVYLPDLKYINEETAAACSDATDYPAVAKAALRRMAEQVGGCSFSDRGIMTRGMIIRHLILPNRSKEACEILDWILGELPDWVYVSLMRQYVPYGRALSIPSLNRRITSFEYNRVVDYALSLDMDRVFIQGKGAADTRFIPDFSVP